MRLVHRKASPLWGNLRRQPLRRKRLRGGEAAHVASLELRLSNGQTLQIRVDDVEAELSDLKSRSGRFASDWVQLPGPVVGEVRIDAIVAVVVR